MSQEKMINKLVTKFSRESMESSVLLATNCRTKHMEELTNEELKDLYYSFFPQERPQKTVNRIYQLEQERELKRLRSIILSDAQYMGLYKQGDWTNFNRFMKNKSPLKKGLNNYQLDEFNELIKQFKNMRYKYDKSKTTVGSASWYKFLGIVPSVN